MQLSLRRSGHSKSRDSAIRPPFPSSPPTTLEFHSGRGSPFCSLRVGLICVKIGPRILSTHRLRLAAVCAQPTVPSACQASVGPTAASLGTNRAASHTAVHGRARGPCSHAHRPAGLRCRFEAAGGRGDGQALGPRLEEWRARSCFAEAHLEHETWKDTRRRQVLVGAAWWPLPSCFGTGLRGWRCSARWLSR